MTATFDGLAELKVADVMTRQVVTVSANMTMSEAADLFMEKQITGAPVVDEHGRCVGVVSGTDFVHSKAEEGEGGSHLGNYLCSCHPSGLYRIDEVRQELVRQHMTPAVQTIDQQAPLLTAAKCMCSEHVHRLVVLDERTAPVGILTSLDLIKALVQALETEGGSDHGCV